MSTDEDAPVVLRDGKHHRLVVELQSAVAELVYEREDGRLIIVHTGVPEAIEGRGVAGQLVRAAVKLAVDEKRTVVPWCPYARRWLREHPDVAGTVEIDWQSMPGDR
jgi:uncharacterized protein